MKNPSNFPQATAAEFKKITNSTTLADCLSHYSSQISTSDYSLIKERTWKENCITNSAGEEVVLSSIPEMCVILIYNIIIHLREKGSINAPQTHN